MWPGIRSFGIKIGIGIIAMIGIIVLLAMSVRADDLSTNLVDYWSFDSNNTDLVGAVDFTDGSTGTANGILNNGLSCAVNQYLKATVSQYRGSDSQGSVSLWFNTSQSTATEQIFTSSDQASTNYYWTIQIHGADSGKVQFCAWGPGNCLITQNTGFNDGDWHHLIVSSNSSAYLMYIDGVRQALTVNTGSDDGDWYADIINRDNLEVCRLERSTAGYYYNGLVDEIGVWSVMLDDGSCTAGNTCGSDIALLYNNGSGCNPVTNPTGCSGDTYPTITANNSWDDSAITTFWAYIDSTNYTTTNGTINLDAEFTSETVQIGATDYFTRSFASQTLENNTDTNYQIYQSQITFVAQELITNDTLTGVTFTTNSTEGTTIYPSAGTGYVVLAQKSGYYDISQSFNVTALDNKTVTVTGMYDAYLTVNLTDIVTGDTIENTGYVTIDDNAGYTQTFSNSTGLVQLPTIQGNYSLTMWADDYAYAYYNITISNSTPYYTTSLYANNSVWVVAYDSATGSPLTNFSIELYNDNYTYPISDLNTGTAKLEDVVSGIYTLRVDKTGYSSATYPLTMTGGSHQNVDAYLSGGASTTIFTVTNIISNAIIEGATVDQYRTVNGSWTLVSSDETDITGRVQISYASGIEYKFIISMTGFETRTFYLKPLYSTYTVRLTPSTSTDTDTNTGGWVYHISDSDFTDGQTNNFTISITSGTGTLEYYNLTVTNYNGTQSSADCALAAGCSDDFSLTITDADNNDTIIVEYRIKESGRSEKYFKHVYPIGGVSQDTTFTGWNQSDMTDGIGDLEKVVIATLVILIICGVVATASTYVGIGPLVPTGFALVITIIGLGFVGFIPMWSVYLIGIGAFLMLIFGRGET